MSDSTLVTLVSLGGLLATIGIFAMVWKVVAMVREQQSDAITAAAARKGWEVEFATDGAYKVTRFRGTTDEVRWVAETRRWSDNERTHWPNVTRWHAATAHGPATPILIVRDRSELARVLDASSSGLGAMVANLASSVSGSITDVLFGREAGAVVDIAAMRAVPGASMPHFTVLAADPADALRVLKGGVADAVARVARNSGSILAADNAPALLLTPTGVHLARKMALTVPDAERFASAGAAVVRALR